MKIKMFEKKRIMVTLLTGLLSMCMLTGCGNKIPDMTEAEMAMITAYASNLIAQYSPKYQSRLIDTEKEAKRREEIAAKAAKVQELIEANKEAEEAKKEEAKQNLENTPVVGGNGTSGQTYTDMKDLAEYLNQEGFRFSYEGYDITKSYPSEESDEWTPTIDASKGKSLLILHIGVTNELDTVNKLDLISQDVLFHIESDAGNTSVIATLLLDDLSYANEEMDPKQMNNYVLVAQIDDGVAAVNEMNLRVKNGGESIVVKIL